MTSIGEYAFADMRAFFPRIADINLQSLDSLKSIGDFAFYNSICTTSTGLDGKKLTIPASVQKIGTAAFGYSVDARTQQISSLYTNAYSIGPSAFMRGHLREVSLGDDVLSIGDFAFANPKYKFTICIPQNVKHIGAGVFKRNIILNPDAIEKNIISADFDSAL